jgi:hypothetical protein
MIVILSVCHLFYLIIYHTLNFISLGNIDKAGQGKLFIMIYDPFKPLRIPIQIQSLSATRVRISFIPPKIGIYRIYIAYRSIPLNGR